MEIVPIIQFFMDDKMPILYLILSSLIIIIQQNIITLKYMINYTL